jgi:hypothetical protein
MMKVSEITDGDIDAVVALWRRCDLTRPWNDPHADLAQARATATSAVLVGHVASASTAIAAGSTIWRSRRRLRARASAAR